MNKIIKWISVLAAVIAFTAIPASVNSAQAETATIDMEIGKVGFIIGFSGGHGTITYNGKTYPIKASGVSLGATIAFASVELTGTISNFATIEDIYGNYSAVSAGLAIAAGGNVAQLQNGKGVTMEVGGRTIGLEFTLDLNGVQISPR